MEVFLEILNGAEAHRKISLPKNQILRIGRTSRSDLILRDDQRVSSVHCEVQFDGTRVHLTDLQSRNGSYVNEQGVRECELKSGDCIRLGLTNIEVVLVGSKESAPATARDADMPPPASHPVGPSPLAADSGSLPPISRPLPPPVEPMGPPSAGGGPIMQSYIEPNSSSPHGASYSSAGLDSIHPQYETGSVPDQHSAGDSSGAIETNDHVTKIDSGAARNSPLDSFGDDSSIIIGAQGSARPAEPPQRVGQTEFPTSNPASQPTPGSPSNQDSLQRAQPLPPHSNLPPATPGYAVPMNHPAPPQAASAPPAPPLPNESATAGRTSPIGSVRTNHPPPQGINEPQPAPSIGDRGSGAVPGIAAERRSFQVTACPGGIECYASESPLQDANAFQPTSIVDTLASSGLPAVVVLHFQKANLKTPDELSHCHAVMDWLSNDTDQSAFKFGPVLVPYATLVEQRLVDCLNLLWDKDACQAFLGRDFGKLFDYLSKLIHKPIPNFNPDGGYFYYCWPSVLGQVLMTNEAETIDAVFADAIDATLMPGSEPSSWRVFGRPGFGNVLRGSGLVEMQAPPA